ncbi:hypothetical protein D3C86_1628460 [compost metagenome]
MTANTWVQPHAFNDLAAVKPMSLGIGIQFVEISDPHGEVGVGKQLDRFRLRAVGQQNRYVLLDGTLLQEGGKTFSTLGTFTHYDARGMQIVIKRPTLSQKFRGKDYIFAT